MPVCWHTCVVQRTAWRNPFFPNTWSWVLGSGFHSWQWGLLRTEPLPFKRQHSNSVLTRTLSGCARTIWLSIIVIFPWNIWNKQSLIFSRLYWTYGLVGKAILQGYFLANFVIEVRYLKQVESGLHSEEHQWLFQRTWSSVSSTHRDDDTSHL